MFPDRFNLAHYLLEHNLEAARGSKVALRWRDEAHTYAGLSSASNRLAHALTDLGLRMEERVLIALSDRPEFSHAWFATLKCGAVFAMVNPLLNEDDYAYYLEYTRARIAVIDEKLAPSFARLARHSRHLRSVIVADGDSSLEGAAGAGDAAGGPAGAVDPVTAPVAEARLPPRAAPAARATRALRADPPGGRRARDGRHAQARCRRLAVHLGLHRQAQGRVHSHADFAFNGETLREGRARLPRGRRLRRRAQAVLRLRDGHEPDVPVPRRRAARVLFPGRSDADELFDPIERYRPTFLTSRADDDQQHAALAARHARRRATSRACACALGRRGAARRAATTQWKARTRRRDPRRHRLGRDVPHLHLATGRATCALGSLGAAVPGYDCQIVDPQGQPLPDGEPGRLRVRGGSTALCYWADKQKSRETFHGDSCIDRRHLPPR